MTKPDNTSDPLQTQLREDIEDIIKEIEVEAYHLSWEKHMNDDVDQILALFQSNHTKTIERLIESLPEKRTDPHKGNIAYGETIGFNKAIAEVTNLLRGELDNE